MALVEDEIIAEGVQIIWVLEVSNTGRPATAQECRNFIGRQGGTTGLCVGDDETMPNPDVFDQSPFAIGRGFDIIMKRSDMRILWVSTHGTPGGNENLTGQDVLDELRRIKNQ